MNTSKATLEHWEVDPEVLRLIKRMNWLILSFLVLPFGNLILLTLFWRKHKHESLIDQLGRKMINAQILWSIAGIIMLPVTYFMSQQVSWVGLIPVYFASGMVVLTNLIIVFKTAYDLHKNNFDFLHFPIRFL